jgi:hypothetical protein
MPRDVLKRSVALWVNEAMGGDQPRRRGRRRHGRSSPPITADVKGPTTHFCNVSLTLRRRPRLSGGSPKYIYAGRTTYGTPADRREPPRIKLDGGHNGGQETRCGLRIDAPSSIVEPVAAGNDVSEGHAATSRRQLQRQPAVRRGLTARVRLMPDNTLTSPQRTPLRSEAAGRRAGPLLQPRLPPPRQGYRPLHR